MILCEFSHEFRNEVRTYLKKWGKQTTEEVLVILGLHPSFVKALVRNILRENK